MADAKAVADEMAEQPWGQVGRARSGSFLASVLNVDDVVQDAEGEERFWARARRAGVSPEHAAGLALLSVENNVIHLSNLTIIGVSLSEVTDNKRY